MKDNKNDADAAAADAEKSTTGRPRRKRGSRSRQPSGAKRLRRAQEIGHQAADQGQHLVEDARRLADTALRGSREAHAALIELSHKNPYVVLAGAAAVGFVAGRRTPLSLSRTALLFVSRLAVSAVLKRLGQRFIDA